MSRRSTVIKCNDRSRRQSRQCARALQTGNSLPSPLSSIPASLPSPSTNEHDRCAKRDRSVQSPIEAKTLDVEAVSAKHWKLIERSHFEMDNLERHACDMRNEMDFDKKIHMMNGLNECHRHRTKRENLSTDFIANFSKVNDINPAVAPSHLHHRSIAEEMLIARAHVHVDF